MDPHGTVSHDELAALRAELAELRSEVARLRHREATDDVPRAVPRPGTSGSRRQMIRGAVGLGAGVAAAGLVARPAAAGTPDPVFKETGNVANADTLLQSTSKEAFIGRSSSTTDLAAGVKGEATGASGTVFGVHGRAVDSPDARGVRGDGPVGVEGISANANGIAVVGYANGQSGTGVRGTDDNTAGDGFGVIGESKSSGGAGVFGTGKQHGGVFEGDRSALRIQSKNTEEPPFRNDQHSAGEVDLDGAGNLWACVEGGLPGVWRKLAGPTSSGSVHMINPYRAYDSRFGDGVLVEGTNRSVTVTDSIDPVTGALIEASALPARATGVFFNLTITGTFLSGFLAVTPTAAASAGGSSINWSASGQTTANGTQVQLTPDTGQVKVFAGGPLGALTHFIIDITGYTL